MKLETSLIADWIAENGAPRRFETGVSNTFEYCVSYLHRFDIRVRAQSWRCLISQNNGPWRQTSRSYVLKLVDEFRALEGLEPLQAVHS